MKARYALLGAALFAVASLPIVALPSCNAAPVQTSDVWVLVYRVLDGDTIAYFNQGEVRVRLSNIDAPELRGKCDSERELAERARDRMRELVSGKWVALYDWGRRDLYGRVLAKIRTTDGADVGDELVAEGLARKWTGRREPWC